MSTAPRCLLCPKHPFPTPGREPCCCATLFTSFFCFNVGNHFKAGTTQGLSASQSPIPAKTPSPASVPSRQGSFTPGLFLPCSCSVCTSYSSTAKPRMGRKNLQKAQIETASLLLSVSSKESENKGTKANTDYSNNLFNLLLLPEKDLRHQPKKQERQRESLCLCCERPPRCCPVPVRTTGWSMPPQLGLHRGAQPALPPGSRAEPPPQHYREQQRGTRAAASQGRALVLLR